MPDDHRHASRRSVWPDRVVRRVRNNGWCVVARQQDAHHRPLRHQDAIRQINPALRRKVARGGRPVAMSRQKARKHQRKNDEKTRKDRGRSHAMVSGGVHQPCAVQTPIT